MYIYFALSLIREEFTLMYFITSKYDGNSFQVFFQEICIALKRAVWVHILPCCIFGTKCADLIPSHHSHTLPHRIRSLTRHQLSGSI